MMKKLQLCLMALVMSVFSVNAQQEVSPTTGTSPESSNALFDLLATFDVGLNGAIGAQSQAGVMFFQDQYWVSTWNADTIHVLDNAGAFVETFTIPGVTGTRSMTTDGTNVYIGTASTMIFEIDPVTRTISNTINIVTGSNAEARMCTYDATLDGGNGGFWIGDFGSDIASVSMIGLELSVIPGATHGLAIYGGAIDNLSPGGPFLWIHHQSGTTGDPMRDEVVQLDPATGIPTGVLYNFFVDGQGAGATDVLAGGLFVSADTVAASAASVFALVGLCQCSPSNLIFEVELTSSLGTSDNELSNFSMYPNPSDRGVVTIETAIAGEKQVAVFDVLGKKVISTTVNNELNVSRLTAGVYLVQVTQNEISATKKLIIK